MDDPEEHIHVLDQHDTCLNILSKPVRNGFQYIVPIDLCLTN